MESFVSLRKYEIKMELQRSNNDADNFFNIFWHTTDVKHQYGKTSLAVISYKTTLRIHIITFGILKV